MRSPIAIHTRLFGASFLVFSLSIIATAQSQPALHAILLDNSGSLRSQFNRVVTLGKVIIENCHGEGPISIFSFKGQGNPKDAPPLMVAHTGWNQDRTFLSNYVDSLLVEPGQTNLLDAVHSMVNHINAKAEAEKNQGTRKVLVLITDGEDRQSQIKEKTLIAELQHHQIQVYAIGLVQELSPERGFVKGGVQKKAIKFLEAVTKETGGRALFPKSNSGDVRALVEELFAVRVNP